MPAMYQPVAAAGSYRNALAPISQPNALRPCRGRPTHLSCVSSASRSLTQASRAASKLWTCGPDRAGQVQAPGPACGLAASGRQQARAQQPPVAAQRSATGTHRGLQLCKPLLPLSWQPCGKGGWRSSGGGCRLLQQQRHCSRRCSRRVLVLVLVLLLVLLLGLLDVLLV